MTSESVTKADGLVPPQEPATNAPRLSIIARQMARWTKKPATEEQPDSLSEKEDVEAVKERLAKWSMGILNDKDTDEVPGSVLLMSSVANRNEPLGLRNQPARISASSLPSVTYPEQPKSPRSPQEQKRTSDGQIILEPQPDESLNDPLNWPAWRRDSALVSLGLYCMIGGGMTPILAAGFNDVADTYKVDIPKVALTTGLYMMGLGLGSVVASPTAILYGKRPVYLMGCILFILSSVWCALSPNYASLVVARIIQGVAVSPVECLPSATIAEIFFLHERAYRIGIYTLLLLGGKNLVPLASAAVIQSLGWRWVFWVVAIVVGFFFFLLFFFVPETFWDRTPRPRKRKVEHTEKPLSWSLRHPLQHFHHDHSKPKIDDRDGTVDSDPTQVEKTAELPTGDTIAERRYKKSVHVEFDASTQPTADTEAGSHSVGTKETGPSTPVRARPDALPMGSLSFAVDNPIPKTATHDLARRVEPNPNDQSAMPNLRNLNSPYYLGVEKADSGYFDNLSSTMATAEPQSTLDQGQGSPATPARGTTSPGAGSIYRYTTHLRRSPPRSFLQTLKPYHGQLRYENWLKVAIRPFILFAYPAVLWSTVVYSLSVGWLIVLSESVAHIYRTRDTYNFTSLQTGLVYLSPFIGGVLGTAVAGKVSDILVRFMAKRNDGVYEPEFRLLMALPVALSTAIGLMGFGWSAEEKDAWIVPTVFFGIISFGCSLGSTTAITFCVDSYRQYAGEALVTLNFSKNIFHGLVFSLFFNRWLDSQGAKKVFLALGGIQLACLMFTIPLYIYGKRARMWTVRKNLMERF
ncbi:MAG: hypothetical protein M1814_000619 [Vezdaea aestivalis]|nr:MAG: hypothetical protein M1814_000619 [Vezdaea aestivalis]